MDIPWAVYGEKLGGHALLVASNSAGFFGSITQYTDRPGDPPFGLEWGPAISGFHFGDHYVLLRCLPDANAGRAGMVRSYAAFLPVNELGSIGNLTVVFDSLPCDLSKPPSFLCPIKIDEQLLSKTHTGSELPGLAHIALELCSQKPNLPLVWSSDKPYLPVIDAIWANLPTELRSKFAFSFQFAPEHKLPVTPLLVATLPSLAGRWSSTQINLSNQLNIASLNTAQKWFAGVEDGIGFGDILRDYALKVGDFSEFNLLSTFADLVIRLPDISFVEARKAVRILEKHSKLTNTSAKKRLLLFDRICRLVSSASPEEIQTIRNFNPKSLPDLIPNLQDSIERWVQLQAANTKSLPQFIEMMELAAQDPNTWWSTRLIKWLLAFASSTDLSETPTLYKIVFTSSILTDFISARLSSNNSTEDKLLAGMPAELSQEQKKNILTISKERGWMRLHAKCLLLTKPKSEAILIHAEAAIQSNGSTAGLEFLNQQLGFTSLLSAACKSNNKLLITYVGRRLRTDCSQLPLEFGADCANWAVLLTQAVNSGGGRVSGKLRDLMIAALQTSPVSDLQSLSEACYTHDITIFLDLEEPLTVLNRLPQSLKSRVLTGINFFILDEIKLGRIIELKNPGTIRKCLDVSKVLNALQSIHPNEAATIGAKVFRSLKFFTDSECKEWLVDLFTRTQHHPLHGSAVVDISSLLMSNDYPLSAKIVFDTVEDYGRKDVAPILNAIQNKYQMTKKSVTLANSKNPRLRKVLIATALPLERDAIMSHLRTHEYDLDLCADMAIWPSPNAIFQVYIITTGANNLNAQQATLNILKHIKPELAFLLGVGGGVKDSEVGDVVYSTKVYYVEGGKEEKGGFKARPESENSSGKLVQLAHRVAEKVWQPTNKSANSKNPKATPAVIASGEKVLTSTSGSAVNYQKLKANYNDTQVVDMEAYGFLRAFRDHEVNAKRMVIRGVSDKIKGKSESDAAGNQPLAAKNAAAFLFALLQSYSNSLESKKKQKRQ